MHGSAAPAAVAQQLATGAPHCTRRWTDDGAGRSDVERPWRLILGFSGEDDARMETGPDFFCLDLVPRLKDLCHDTKLDVLWCCNEFTHQTLMGVVHDVQVQLPSVRDS